MLSLRNTILRAAARQSSRQASPTVRPAFTIITTKPVIASRSFHKSLLRADANNAAPESVEKEAVAKDPESDALSHFEEQPRELKPSRVLWVGNLYYGLTEEKLKEEFSQFGNVIKTRIVRNPNGESRGFGYIEFETQAEADEALERDGYIFYARKLSMQYHNPKGKKDSKADLASLHKDREVHPPSRTLFIGNMSYQISDADLNNLFQDVKCEKIRVAVDRRTGQPRGFCHVDFRNIEDASEAKEILQKKELFGRTLRVNFSEFRER
ncbi:RNA-binding domain-containing protein [Piedraia hortae CBS 480.64]|uniref:RNA-binding domain-containing protein n=1 Tax=Piedraia hortae CBS 480.64 TaxID=1314780 RepID=A0A6A7BWK4_9PEZI|nr:RNA-binding domain-containing protein [Piedraia hortae CBS 480.64]